MGKHKPFQRKASTVVVDSGATSSFVMLEENLPITGPSNKVVALPDGATKQATHTAILPFESLSDEARKADVLPGLRPNSLISVGKFADADYTTIFHPRGEGVTVHKKKGKQFKYTHLYQNIISSISPFRKIGKRIPQNVIISFVPTKCLLIRSLVPFD